MVCVLTLEDFIMPLEGDAKARYQRAYMRRRYAALKKAEALQKQLTEARRKIKALQNELLNARGGLPVSTLARR
jgi:hypothetical protein